MASVHIISGYPQLPQPILRIFRTILNSQFDDEKPAVAKLPVLGISGRMFSMDPYGSKRGHDQTMGCRINYLEFTIR